MKTYITALSSAAHAVALIGALCAPAAFASSINYGNVDDFAGGGVVEFQNVTESSPSGDPLPLFGAPDAVVNRLDFDPVAFAASSAGAAPSITDGQLNYSFRTLPGKGISSLVVEEGGDFSLIGVGTTATNVNYGLFAKVTVTEVSGVPVTPFSVTASTFFSKNLVANPGGSQPWGAALLIDLGPAIAANGYGTSLATKGEFVLNNTLVALSEPTSVAFIAKKDIFVDTVPFDDQGFIPEPSAAVLALAGALVAGPRRRG
jgi:hypothetical protein